MVGDDKNTVKIKKRNLSDSNLYCDETNGMEPISDDANTSNTFISKLNVNTQHLCKKANNDTNTKSTNKTTNKSTTKNGKKKRCPICNIKLKLTDLPCKCNISFCSKHRLPEMHNCNYDFKTQGKNKLASQNILVINEKINKI